MNYTIKQVSEKYNLPISTIRYYDKEGLLPNIKRKESGYRLFSDDDLSTLEWIECFKATGMSIKEIKYYFDLCQQGDETLQERYEIILQRKESTLKQMEDLQKQLGVIDYKINYYQEAIEAGTEAIHKN